MMGTVPKKISHRKHLALVNDYEKAAAIASLTYVSDSQPGILRKKAGTGFSYLLEEKPVKDKNMRERIKKLAIPPAWSAVWICTKENGHIQATGFDVKKRKQYRYHPLWTVLRNETKFHKMIEFGKSLPVLRLQLEKDLAIRDLTDRKVLATVISLMERTYIRIGNSTYEKLNGSHGLSTLHDRHVKIKGSEISFNFTGKKSINHTVHLSNRRLARIVEQCRDVPGKELFQYYDAEGKSKPIDSGMLNNYIKGVTDQGFTAKDFRTWAGCLHFLLAFKNLDMQLQKNPTKTAVNEMLDFVSKKLGNTPTVCRKYYVHPNIIQLYEENKLQIYLKDLDGIEENDDVSSLTNDEKVLMKLLAKMS